MFIFWVDIFQFAVVEPLDFVFLNIGDVFQFFFLIREIILCRINIYGIVNNYKLIK